MYIDVYCKFDNGKCLALMPGQRLLLHLSGQTAHALPFRGVGSLSAPQPRLRLRDGRRAGLFGRRVASRPPLCAGGQGWLGCYVGCCVGLGLVAGPRGSEARCWFGSGLTSAVWRVHQRRKATGRSQKKSYRESHKKVSSTFSPR